MSELRVTHKSQVTEEQIDHLGHMNVRYYAINAKAGTQACLEALGWDGPTSIHDIYTRHHHEQLLGTPLEVRSLVLAAGTEGIDLHHELRASDSDDLAATFVHRVAPLDGDGQRTGFPDRVVAAAAEQVGAVPDYATTRTVSLDTDLLASAPTLEVAVERGLAMRKPRQVSADECHPDGSYETSFAAVLTWGGEPIDERARGDIPHKTDGGARMAWAAMENRVTVNAWPRRGDRIQSFGAPVEVFDKVVHRIQWAFDLDTGVLLNAFEVVSLAFDINARRPMSIPDRFRAYDLDALQPDLLPR